MGSTCMISVVRLATLLKSTATPTCLVGLRFWCEPLTVFVLADMHFLLIEGY